MANFSHRCRPKDCRFPDYLDTCTEHDDNPCEGRSDNNDKKVFCALRTFAASHLAAFVPFLIWFVWALIYIYQKQFDNYQKLVVFEIGLIAGISFIFYLIGYLMVEEIHTWKLRVLRRYVRILELCLRGFILFSFGYGVTYIPTYTTPAIILGWVFITYSMFLIWDALLYFGPRAEITNWQKVSNDLRQLATDFALFDLGQWFFAVGAIIGYKFEIHWLLAICVVFSCMLFIAWIIHQKEYTKELKQRFRCIDAWR